MAKRMRVVSVAMGEPPVKQHFLGAVLTLCQKCNGTREENCVMILTHAGTAIRHRRINDFIITKECPECKLQLSLAAPVESAKPWQ